MRSIGLHGGLRLVVVIENVCYGGASLNNVVNSLSWNKHCMAILCRNTSLKICAVIW